MSNKLAIKPNDSNGKRSLERMAPTYIRNYFRDKKIPSEVDIISPKYVDLCVNTNMCEGADKAYRILSESGKFSDSSAEHSISEDIRFVISILSDMKKHVPQELSAGMLLMHLELVEGLSHS